MIQIFKAEMLPGKKPLFTVVAMNDRELLPANLHIEPTSDAALAFKLAETLNEAVMEYADEVRGNTRKPKSGEDSEDAPGSGAPRAPKKPRYSPEQIQEVLDFIKADAGGRGVYKRVQDKFGIAGTTAKKWQVAAANSQPKPV